MIHTFFIFPDVKKLIECNKNRDCPKTLPRCHRMERPTFSGKKGYCVFKKCQYCQGQRNCPSIGPPLCPLTSPNEPGGLGGSCNVYRNKCEYSRSLDVARCPPYPGKVLKTVSFSNYCPQKTLALALALILILILLMNV